MKYTENLELKKPEQEEFYDVDDFNYNADILDEQITNIKNGYVKKTGDSMSGNLSFDANHNIHANSNDGQLVFMGGSEWDKGAGIALWGKDKNGSFTIHSVDENGNMKTLCGWNNGSLTWCDEELATEKHVSDNYLSLNGGIMKGDIVLDDNNICGSWYRLRNNDDNSFIGLSGGGSHTWETSSTLVLFGNNAGDNAGRAVLNSHGHNLAVCQNGQLLFDNQNIVRSVNGVNADAQGNVTLDISSGATVVETYVNGSSWYRIWSNGWLEQGGTSGDATTIGSSATGKDNTVTFLKPFENTKYSLVATGGGTDSNTKQITGDSIGIKAKTTTTSVINLNNVDSVGYFINQFTWYACGQGA